MNNSRLYLDYNATAPLLPAAHEAMLAALDLPGNPSSVHAEGRAARAVVSRARQHIATLVGTTPNNVIFTSGATEAAATIMTPHFKMGRADLAIGQLYVSAVEHPCVLAGGRFDAARVSVINVLANGLVDVDHLASLLDVHDRASGLPMVAVQMANNETGICQDIQKIAELVKASGGIMLVDAVQAAGRLPIDFDALGVDFLILSSHKIGGPKGAGAIICAGEIMMPNPLIPGGGQEKGHRSGTENPAAIAGFGAAAECAARDLTTNATRISRLRDGLEAEMLARAPDCIIHGDNVERLFNTTFFSLPDLKAETAQIAFDLEGIAVSAGSACSSGKVGPSHVLAAMGRDTQVGGLRVSLGAATTDDEIDRFLVAFDKLNQKRLTAMRNSAAQNP